MREYSFDIIKMECVEGYYCKWERKQKKNYRETVCEKERNKKNLYHFFFRRGTGQRWRTTLNSFSLRFSSLTHKLHDFLPWPPHLFHRLQSSFLFFTPRNCTGWGYPCPSPCSRDQSATRCASSDQPAKKKHTKIGLSIILEKKKNFLNSHLDGEIELIVEFRYE